MLRLREIWHAYDEVPSLRGASLDLQPGEILCLLGPSGCGKTTLLRIIAGLDSDYRGTVTLEGADIRGMPAHQRGFGLMFQDFALFPHMSVAQNVAYGLKRRGQGKRDIQRRVADLLGQVGLTGLGERDVAALSGGQKQRVALARSLAPNPRLLMLDEPLGSLDARLRDQLALELRAQLKGAGISAIYVTHDRREAYAVADRIAVMQAGAVRQCDTPLQLYRQPQRVFVAQFLGMRNIYALDENTTVRRLAEQAGALQDEIKHILIHPRGISLAQKPIEPSRPFDAVVKEAVFRGEYWDVSLALDDGLRLSLSAPELRAKVGESLELYIALESVLSLSD